MCTKNSWPIHKTFEIVNEWFQENLNGCKPHTQKFLKEVSLSSSQNLMIKNAPNTIYITQLHLARSRSLRGLGIFTHFHALNRLNPIYAKTKTTTAAATTITTATKIFHKTGFWYLIANKICFIISIGIGFALIVCYFSLVTLFRESAFNLVLDLCLPTNFEINLCIFYKVV